MLKSAIKAMQPTAFLELERSIDALLLQYCNAQHAVTKESPAQLFKGRTLRANLNCIIPSEVMFSKGNNYRPSEGIVLQQLGKRMIQILDLEDGSCHKRHYNQIMFRQIPSEKETSITKEHEQSRIEKCSNPITLPFDSQNEPQDSRPKENEENNPNPAEMKEQATFEKEKTTEPEPVRRRSE